jgi:hypothetical protein
MSRVLPGLAFARTDVGGAYRYDPLAQRWMAITDWVGHIDSNLLGIESIAVDPVDPKRVYLAAGQYLAAGYGTILSSIDMGQTWASNSISAPMGGDENGRTMGERLAIDPNLPSTLYFASHNTGLWTSPDFAQTWIRVGGFPATSTGTPYGLTFVVFDPRSGSRGTATQSIYIGVEGSSDTGLYHTADGGTTWAAVAGPAIALVPHHAVADGCGNLFIAYNDGPGPNNIATAAVWRYGMTSLDWANVSPPGAGGFGGIAADAAGTLIVTTGTGEIYRSTNAGDAVVRWVALSSAAQLDGGGAPWLLAHGPTVAAPGWMGDVQIDPFNPNRALYTTGEGIWSSDDATNGALTHWRFDNDGLEETVLLDLVSPPTGAPLLSAVRDIAGFRHDDLDVSPAGGFFDNPVFGTTTSLDFAEGAPNIVVRVGSPPSGGAGCNASGKCGAYSTDGGATWTPFAAAPAGTGSDGSGSIAVSADGTTFLWAPQSAMPAYSQDNGTTWTGCAGLVAGVRVAADRVNPAKFYASDQNGTNVSNDGGASFVKAPASPSGRPRLMFGIEGDVWVPTDSGLFHSQDSAATFTQVGGSDSAPNQQVNSAGALGFGMAAPGKTYPAVYLAGSVGGVWGTYRSDDAGATWQRIDDPQHQFGLINCLTGDPRRYGRVYLGTGGRGILYGDAR